MTDATIPNSSRAVAEFHASFQGRIGVARRDITPPVGIYARMWGCAKHDTAEGVHRPLVATVLSFQAAAGGEPLVVIGLDLGWWRSREDEWFLRGEVLDACALEPARLMIHLVHTHSGPFTSLSAKYRPGGRKIEPYLCRVRQTLVDAVREAVGTAANATLTWTAGRCDLARNRDLPDPEAARTLCGYNPGTAADDTLLVGRVTGDSGQVRATIVNYACHPTSLGGANRLISPDYVGALRQVVEGHTDGAPCLFLQGASGELAPRQQYMGDPAVADRNGAQLGHAVLSALSGALPHGRGLAFAGAVESEAALADWQYVEALPSDVVRSTAVDVDLPLRDLPSLAELTRQLDECRDRVAGDRLERAVHQRKAAGDGRSLRLSLCAWRLGDSYLVGVPGEAYSDLQVELRRRFPGRAVAVMNIVNGYFSYLPSAAAYAAGAYPSSVTPFQPGCLEQVIEATAAAMRGLE